MVTANLRKPGLASRSASAVRFIRISSLHSWPRRRAVLQKAAAAATAAVPLAASAKAGQFGKQEFFSIVGSPGISSPSAGGDRARGPGAKRRSAGSRISQAVLTVTVIQS